MLLKGFFETMKVPMQFSQTMFFLNAGVHLTKTDAETVAILYGIEGRGAEISLCGACMKHYDLEPTLKVGHLGMTNLIVDGWRISKRWFGY